MNLVLILLTMATSVFAADIKNDKEDLLIPQEVQKRLHKSLSKRDAQIYFNKVTDSIESQLKSGKTKAEIVIDPDKCDSYCRKEVVDLLRENSYETNRVPISK